MIKKVKAIYVDTLPNKNDMEEGIVYISEKAWRASHLCPFGKTEEIITPLIRGGWSFFVDKNDAITLSPAITCEVNNITYTIQKGYAIA